LLETCQLDVNSLIFDCTNFDTFIDTENRSRLPQRGHAKSKRTDLRSVGLALLVSVDFHVPSLWKVYPGNQYDRITFAQALQERTLVITFSPELQRKQIRGIEQHLSKKRRALEELQAKLRRSQQPGAKGKGYSRESLTKRVRQICSGQHISKILRVSVIEKRRKLKLFYRTEASAFAQIKEHQLGKRILFTDQKSWSNEQIILAYRSQSQVESAF